MHDRRRRMARALGVAARRSGAPPRGAGLALGTGLALIFLLLAAGALAASADRVHQSMPRELRGAALQPPLPPVTTYPNQLVLDDNGAESVVGVFGATSRQFLWFNRFSAGAVELQEIWVFFPAGEGVSAGDDIQLVVYEDPDGDPTNGANLVLSLDTTVQVANGTDFSIYSIPPTMISGGDTLVGVIPRFVTSGVTPPTSPAALDNTASQGRSYFAFWLGDPPASPTLPPDDEVVLVDDLLVGGGNWAIRAFGVSTAAPTEIPAVSPAGLVVLCVLLAVAATFILDRRHPSTGLLPGSRRGRRR